MDFVQNIKQRYTVVTTFGGGFTLVHKLKPKPEKQPEAPQKFGIFEFIKPHISTLGRRIFDEVSAVFTKRAEASERSLETSVNRGLQSRMLEFKQFSQRIETEHKKTAAVFDKRINTVVEQNNKQVRQLKRDMETLIQRREAAAKRAVEQTPAMERPVSRKAADTLITRQLEAANAELRAEIEQSADQSARKAVRMMKELEEYERMRSAGGRKFL